MTLQEDLSTVLEAADNWSSEIVEYIAPAIDDEGDREESAKAAGALDDAIRRVSAAAIATTPPAIVYAEDGGSTLETKAGYAAAAVSTYNAIAGGQPLAADDTDALYTAATDLIADLAHWAALNELDMQELVSHAMEHVAAEAGSCFTCGGPVQLLGEQQTTPYCKPCTTTEADK